MKKINKLLFISLLQLFSMSQSFARGSAMPNIERSTNSGGPYIDQVKELAEGSTCASTSWNGRGKAPLGYIKGVTLSYARSYCRLKAGSSLSNIMSAAASGNPAKDALAHYE